MPSAPRRAARRVHVHTQTHTPSASLRDGLLGTAVVATAVANRTSHRIMLVPMLDYTFLIAQACTICYTFVYGLILTTRILSGAVPRKQIASASSRDSLPLFATIGAFEAVVFVFQLWASARLPGVLIVILAQVLLPCTMAISALMLGKRYKRVQIVGVAAVISGVLVCTIPAAGRGQANLIAATAYALGCVLLAAAVVLKERLLQRNKYDVFIVNTFGSAFQAVATLALLPISVALATSLPPAQYLTSGIHALFNAQFMPWLTLIYITCNISFNIAALTLVKTTSAPTVILTNLLSVPIVALVFCFPLPLLTPTPFSWSICIGLVIIIVGVLLYNRDIVFKSSTAVARVPASDS